MFKDFEHRFNQQEQKAEQRPNFDQVVYAGGSQKRYALLQRVIDTAYELIGMPAGEEPNEDVEKVAAFKLGKAAGEHSHDRTLFVATDTQTYLGPKGNVLTRRTKPNSHDEIRDNLGAILPAGGYLVRAFTAAKTNGSFYGGEMSCRVDLVPEMLADLQTDEGFQKYCKGAEAFYGHKTYTDHGFNGDGLFSFSAGFSLPAFWRIGGVAKINGVNLKDLDELERFNRLKAAIYTVAVRIAPEILTKINPEAVTLIDNWPWLNDAAQTLLQ